MIKSIFIFLVLLFSLSGVSGAQERSLYDSDSLMWVLDELYPASYDFAAIYLVEEKLDPVRSQIPQEGCVEVKAEVVKNYFQRAFNAYQNFYPDNELPFDQAEKDLEYIMGDDAYLQCSEKFENKWESIEVDHFRKVRGGIWIRFEVSQRKPCLN